MKYFFIFLLIMNLITFTAYGIDKRKAIKDRWRIPEKTLLLLGLMFGSVGRLAGMKFFHHKTHKWYFWLCTIGSLILHIVILYYIITNCIV